MNLVALMGRLTADPELRYTKENTPVCTFKLAVDRPGGNNRADFPSIVAWRDTAEFASKYLRKGQRIALKGELRTRDYEDRDGKHRVAVEVEADRIEFADSKPADR